MSLIERKATLTIHGEASWPISILAPTQGANCLDIRTLGGRSGYFAYDSSFESTAGCKSKITCIDGEKGEVLHYGYPIEQLAEQCDFLEVAYLLKNGELPNAVQKQSFESAIRKQASVHEQMVKFYQGFRRDARPMAVMVGVVGALSAFHHDAADFSDTERRNLSFHRIVARMPTIVAMAYKYSIGEPFMTMPTEIIGSSYHERCRLRQNSRPDTKRSQHAGVAGLVPAMHQAGACYARAAPFSGADTVFSASGDVHWCRCCVQARFVLDSRSPTIMAIADAPDHECHGCFSHLPLPGSGERRFVSH